MKHETVVTIVLFLGVAAMSVVIQTQGHNLARTVMLCLWITYWVHYSVELNWYTAQWNDHRAPKRKIRGDEHFITASHTSQQWDALSDEEKAAVYAHNWKKYFEHRTPEEISEEVHVDWKTKKARVHNGKPFRAH